KPGGGALPASVRHQPPAWGPQRRAASARAGSVSARRCGRQTAFAVRAAGGARARRDTPPAGRSGRRRRRWSTPLPTRQTTGAAAWRRSAGRRRAGKRRDRWRTPRGRRRRVIQRLSGARCPPGPGPPWRRSGLRRAGSPGRGKERPEEVDRNREEGCRGPLGGDLSHGLEESELNRDRRLRQDGGRLGELSARWSPPLRVADVGPPLALGLGLLRHRPLHVLREVDVLDLDGGHLHAPGIGVLVDDALELLVDLVAGREEVVELHLTE